MKKIIKNLAFILVLAMMLALAACVSPFDSGSDLSRVIPAARPETERPGSAETGSSPENNTTSESPKPADPEDPSPPPIITTPSLPPLPTFPTPLNFDNAMAICNAWLEHRTDLSSYAVILWEDELEYPPPATYCLFGEWYYRFLVSHQWDGTTGSIHYILVGRETSELLSMYYFADGREPRTTTVERLDDWYASGNTAYSSARLTVDDALAAYNTWMAANYQSEFSQYQLSRESYERYMIFGEQYYYLNAEDDFKYWYNVLVHMDTGELLNIMTSDGMYTEIIIEPLADWFDRW